MSKTAVIYARVSTEDQKENGFSIQDQIARMKKHCRNNDITPILVLEEDHSAKNFKRPTFQKFLEDIKEGAIHPDIFLCVRPDRFSRNLMASLEMMKTLLKYGTKVEFLEQNIDTDNPEDLLMQVIYHALPEIDNKRRSLNVQRGMRQAKREGRWMGTPLRGYEMIKEGGLKLMVPNDKAQLIKEAFTTFSKGLYTMEEVRRQINDKGLKMSKNQFKMVLSNICYTGKIVIPEWKEEPREIVNGLHEPIISTKLFNKVQDILFGRRTQPKGKSKRNENFPLRGYLECNQCGNNITGSGSKSRSGERHYYYHCQKGCKERFRADEANETFSNYLKECKVPEEILSLYHFVIEDFFKQDDAQRKSNLQNYEKQIVSMRTRIESVEDSFYDDLINESEFRRAKKRYQEKLDELILKQGQLSVQKSNFQKYLGYGFSLIQNLDKYYEEANLEVKQKIVGSIFPNKLIYVNKKYRTKEDSPILSLMGLNINGLGAKEKDFPEMISEKSYLVDPQGLEP